MHLCNAAELSSIRKQRVWVSSDRIAPVVPSDDEHFRTWLQQGFNGEMRY
jgi:hypothetical protein